ncbi:uncharacterized protein DUF4326 [Novosphingobium sp. PhB165]|uniref:DUF4326 domain-containing protein n=1 Tax=Novosphingobium sp. PhB165 TaxID=2485105 RepID=UPI00104B2B07|nr:DUF4326 domain-containing protein [Novosphingobium sp. PhB165]TCM21459.1 uncharacterized protein DUF4326 [Novosphingobium sp. PhB165]
MSDAKPHRVQLRRTKGWRMPENTVKVSRPGKFGNPFVIGETAHVWHRPGTAPGWPTEPLYIDRFRVVAAWHAVELFRKAMEGDPEWYPAAEHCWTLPDLTALRGKNLACFCSLDQPCHADVLLELANE